MLLVMRRPVKLVLYFNDPENEEAGSIDAPGTTYVNYTGNALCTAAIGTEEAGNAASNDPGGNYAP